MNFSDIPRYLHNSELSIKLKDQKDKLQQQYNPSDKRIIPLS